MRSAKIASLSSHIAAERDLHCTPETGKLGFCGPSAESGCAGAGMVGTPSCGPEPVPSGAVPEVARVLEAASWYEVLEVSVSATAEEIKRAHKLKSLGTHPDKVGAASNSGAHEASVRVNMVRDFAGPNASTSIEQSGVETLPKPLNEQQHVPSLLQCSPVNRNSLSRQGTEPVTEVCRDSPVGPGLHASLDTADQQTCSAVLVLASVGRMAFLL